MPIIIGNGGNKTVTSITIGNGGNKVVRAVWVGNGGNKLAFAAINLLGLDPSQVGVGGASCTYSITSAGLEQATGLSSNTWMTTGVASDYDVMLTFNSGTSPTGAALGAWLNCGTTRSWTVTRGAVVGINTANCTV